MTVDRIASVDQKGTGWGMPNYVAQAKLSKHGNTIAVSIPRMFLQQLGWLCGRQVVVELGENLDRVTIRKAVPSDFGPPTAPRANTTWQE